MLASWRGRSRKLAAAGADSRRLRFDVLAGEVGVDAVGGRRTGGGGCDRTGPSGRGQGRVGFIEKHALFTRTGPQGIRQVNVRGLVAAAFTHRDSRAGDPDLHTHVAVANKVQTLDGRWLSIDGRVLFKAKVAASETYNTSLEQHLRDALGVRFAARPGTDPAKRPIREIVGVDPRLNERWSTRRAHINIRRGELAVQFQADHGRPPTPVEALHLAQQATLETRNAKHEPRSLAEQRSTWLNEASAALGGRSAVASMVRRHYPRRDRHRADAHWVAQTADRVLTTMEASRSTWQMWHVRAEVQRQVRTIDMPAGQANALVDLLVDEVLQHRSVALAGPPDGIEEPGALRRVDGSSSDRGLELTKVFEDDLLILSLDPDTRVGDSDLHEIISAFVDRLNGQIDPSSFGELERVG